MVATKSDAASQNIANRLISDFGFLETARSTDGQTYSAAFERREIKLVVVEGELVYFQYLPVFSSSDLVIFLSRHESRNGAPLLTAHVPGNLFEASFGGIAGKVSIAPANAVRAALIEMRREKKRLNLEQFQVSYEGTHHGPSLDVPALFVEIGSTQEEWSSPEAAEAVAHAAMAAATCEEEVEAAVALGGSHCNSRLTNHSLDSPIAFGHIIPSYAFSRLNANIVKHCIDRTLESNPTLILDWKGIDGKQREGLMELLKQLDIPFRRLAEY
jgi:D-aminoacyl-tRNA deacylase